MPPISIMIKPASSTCNMRCKYCFYNDVAKNRETPSHGAMSLQTAETVVKKAFAYADGNPVWFNFQGGEPLDSILYPPVVFAIVPFLTPAG